LPNGTFFIELIVSLVLLFLIYKYVLPHQRRWTERQEKIRESLEAADKARADAEAADDERRNVLEEARQQAREIVATANRTAEQVRTDAQARGQGEYERIVGNADVEIALARQRAVEEAASRMGEIVMEVVERVIGREVDAEAHRDLIDEAVPRCGPTRPVAPPLPGPGPGSEPSASGVHGRRGRGGRPGRARWPGGRP
jgi:F-type H+-transporting ATPase subunit b